MASRSTAFVALAVVAAGLVLAPQAEALAAPVRDAKGRQIENLDRGLISVHSSGGNLVSWRLLATDPASVAFHVYRGSTRLTATPLTASTNYFDSGAAASQSYTVRAVVNGAEQAASSASA